MEEDEAIRVDGRTLTVMMNENSNDFLKRNVLWEGVLVP